MESDEIDMKALDAIIRSFTKEAPSIHIGILGSGGRSDSNTTNAEIGAKHEFGSDGMPMRSWLRMPLSDHLADFMENSKAFTPESLRGVIQAKSLLPWVKKIAIVAESVVLEGFSSGGFGRWAKWRGGYTNRTGMILVDSQQLRNSVTSEVK